MALLDILIMHSVKENTINSDYDLFHQVKETL